MSKRYKLKRRARYHIARGTFDAPCWCGEPRPYYAPVYANCGGTGAINCYCGGDQCVCHNHGEVNCYGCPDCYTDDDDDMTLEEFYNRTM